MLQAIKRLGPGDILEVRSIDPGVREDLPAWCRMTGHELLAEQEDSAAQLFAYAGQVTTLSARIYAEVIGCDIVAINDTPATMLKPDYFRRYVVPNLQAAWQAIHRAGKTSSLWA